VGNTFMTEREPVPSLQGYVRVTAQIIARMVARLRPVAVAYGPWDVGPMAPALAALPADVQSGIFWGPNGAARTLPKLGRLVTVGGLKVGLIEGPPMPPAIADVPQGISGAHSTAVAAQDTGTAAAAARLSPAPLDLQDLAAQAQGLREGGAVAVLLLWPHGTDQARAQLGALQNIDVVVAGSEEAPQAPEPLGSATLLDGGARGEYLGLLTLKAGKPGPVRFFDGGVGERDQAQAQASRLLAEAERLPPGPGQEARRRKAQILADKIAAIRTEPPEETYVTWTLLPMDQHLPQAPWALEALAGYNKALCDSALTDTAARTCAPPASAGGTYVGTDACQGCHQQAYAVWQQTAHARAWATLEQADKTCDLSCVGCHVVGFEQAGGFCHLGDAPPFHNVGCESCHGPALGHVQNPQKPEAWARDFTRSPPEATCRGCHNSQHSDQFDFASYRPRVLGPGHGLPAEQPAKP
jgi:hypothetical protein